MRGSIVAWRALSRFASVQQLPRRSVRSGGTDGVLLQRGCVGLVSCVRQDRRGLSSVAGAIDIGADVGGDGEDGKTVDLEEFDLHPRLVDNMRKSKFTKLFPVQAMTIGESKKGTDLVVRSPTGTGKTLAFGIPVIERIYEAKSRSRMSKGKPIAVVITPTRELAVQVCTELEKIAGDLHGVTVYGGAGMYNQIKSLEKTVDYVVATPGRLRDFLDRRVISFDDLEVCVLDEADEMLNFGFEKELREIVSYMPNAEKRQNLLFSATFTKEIMDIAKQYLHEHKVIDLVGSNARRIPEKIELNSVLIGDRNSKISALAQLLQYYTYANSNPNEVFQTLVFTQTKASCDFTASHKAILNSGCVTAPLHGDMNQSSREIALNGFREKRIQCLIATDVAARGLDVPDVDLVVHFDLPNTNEAFVHRTGRTGRAGKVGRSVLMFTPNESVDVQRMERDLGITFVQKPVPSYTMLQEAESKRIVSRLLKTSERQQEQGMAIVDQLKAVAPEVDLEKILAGAITTMTKQKGSSFSALTGSMHKETIVFSNLEGTTRLKLGSKAVQNNTHRAVEILRADVERVLCDTLGSTFETVAGTVTKDYQKLCVDFESREARRILHPDSRRLLHGKGLLVELAPLTLENIIPVVIPNRPSHRRNNSYSKGRFGKSGYSSERNFNKHKQRYDDDEYDFRSHRGRGSRDGGYGRGSRDGGYGRRNRW